MPHLWIPAYKVKEKTRLLHGKCIFAFYQNESKSEDMYIACINGYHYVSSIDLEVNFLSW